MALIAFLPIAIYLAPRTSKDQPVVISAPLSPALIPAIAELEPATRGLKIHRLPATARGQCSDPQLALFEAQPAGTRVA
ncbi:hypothetical protein ACTXLC_09395 [Corynebacterium flavescens]